MDRLSTATRRALNRSRSIPIWSSESRTVWRTAESGFGHLDHDSEFPSIRARPQLQAVARQTIPVPATLRLRARRVLRHRAARGRQHHARQCSHSHRPASM
jgi:hypothetical protein